MKMTIFFEVNENSPALPQLTDVENNVFDAINNAGAITAKGIRQRVPGLLQSEVSNAVNSLLSYQLILRRTLSTTDLD